MQTKEHQSRPQPNPHTHLPDPASGRPAPAPPQAPAPPRRRRRRILLTVGAVLLAVAVGTTLWLTAPATLAESGTASCSDVPTTSALDPGTSTEVREGVCAAIDHLTSAWADQDGQDYGAGFTENATYTTFAGTYYSGRQDIADSHDVLFDGVLEGTRLADAYLGLQVLTDDVAVLTTRGDRYEGDDPGTLTKVQTYTLVRQDGAWRVAAFQNTQRSEAMERIQFLWMPDTRPAAER